MVDILINDEDKLKTSRDVVTAIEDVMRTMPQVEISVEHQFSLGIYARTVYIPKGLIVTGHIHKHENLTTLIQGELVLIVDGKLETLKAPKTFVCAPGTKRILRTIEDCIIMTVHHVGDERDIPTIEHQLVAKSKEEYLEFIKDNQLRLDLQ